MLRNVQSYAVEWQDEPRYEREGKDRPSKDEETKLYRICGVLDRDQWENEKVRIKITMSVDTMSGKGGGRWEKVIK